MISALRRFVRENLGTVINPCDLIPCIGYSAYTPEGELTTFDCPLESLKSIPHDSPSYRARTSQPRGCYCEA